MRRWRARLGLDAVAAVLVAVVASSVLAVGWSAAGAVSGLAPGSALAPADAGSLQVSPSAVQVSQATTLTMSFAAPADPATAPGPAGLATFMTAEGPNGTAALAALRVSPAVTVAPGGGGQDSHGSRGRMPDWLPILLVVAGLVVAAAVAGLLAFRPLASRPRASRPRAFRPLASRPRASRPRRRGGHAVPGATVTTIEERQP